MKILVFVAKSIGLEMLKFILEEYPEDQYTFVVCNPDKRKIMDYLHEHNQHPIDVSDLDDNIEEFDWLLNLWSPYIFRKKILNKVKSSLNVHPSFLPYGRGRDPVVWAIRDQVPAGVTLHKITEGIDEGPIWFKRQVAYEFPVSGQTLYSKVIEESVNFFKEKWPVIRMMDQDSATPQEGTFSTRRRADLLRDQQINFDELSEENKAFINQVLAHDFGEGYRAILNVNNKKFFVNLNLEEILPVESQPNADTL